MHSHGNENIARLMKSMPDAWPLFFYKRGPRPIQLSAIPQILRGESIFLTAPTASGKTEAAIAPLYQRHISFKRDNLSVLYIAPTKALVNDIYYRLCDYLGTDSGSSGVCRYTGDHHDFKEPAGNFILVSTPEALDSLQLTNPHKLQYLRAIVIDEVHFLHGKGRGEQLRYVIDRIRAKTVSPKDPRDNFQIIAMSATLNDMESVGHLWAGETVRIVSATDPRDIGMNFLSIPDGKVSEQANAIAQILYEYIEINKLPKVLIFANTRNDAHELSIALNEVFQGTRWPIFLHFGILEATERDIIEKELKDGRYGICVATATLELGIDIGDIETIMLLSPPQTVSSFLQRIGRGNRRSEICQVVALYRNDSEEILYRSLLNLGRQGRLEPVHEYCRPSVAFQQVTSLAWQGIRTDRPLTMRNIVARSGGHNYADIVDDMLSEGHLKLSSGALILSDELYEQGEMRIIHSVISGSSGRQVVDAVTGQSVASLGVGAGAGIYFLGGQLRSMGSSGSDGYILEKIGKGSSKGIGKIPAARGGGGLSRELAWKIAELTGYDPRFWYWDGDRLVTWGGTDNNQLLVYLFNKHGLGSPSGYDAFAILGLDGSEDVDPERVAELVSDGLDLPLKNAEKFRESTRFYRLLGAHLKSIEASGAVPAEEFNHWLRDCIEEPQLDVLIDQLEDVAEEVVDTETPPDEDNVDSSVTLMAKILESQELKLRIKWTQSDDRIVFAQALTSLFFSAALCLIVSGDDEVEFDDLELDECIALLNKNSRATLRFEGLNFSESGQSQTTVIVELPGCDDDSDSHVQITIETWWNNEALNTPVHDLYWYQSDFNFMEPFPLLALPANGAGFHPMALHGLVALATKTGSLIQADLVGGDGQQLANWQPEKPTNSFSLRIGPVSGDYLWLPVAGVAENAEGFFWCTAPKSAETSWPLKLKESLLPLLNVSKISLDDVNQVMRDRLPTTLSLSVSSLEKVDQTNLMFPAQLDTILLVAPDKSVIDLKVDILQPPDVLMDTILHGVGHVFLGHVCLGDNYGHADTLETIQAEGRLRYWDYSVREAFPEWFKPEIPQVETVEDCTVQEKAWLGLYRMIGEMLGESRRLHARAEKYQLAAYQRQAAQRLLAQLEEYGGAMLCDGVGLGKTYVATTLMVHYANAWRDNFAEAPAEFLNDPFRITVLAPHSVVSTWRREAVPPLAAHGVPLASVRIISHTKLSRITKASEALDRPTNNQLSDLEHLLLSDLVIVDEAHNFRSVIARRSVVLRDLLRLQPRKNLRRKVLLLTATPINNTLDDLMQETALLFSKPLLLSNATTDEGYRRQAEREINDRYLKVRASRTPGGDISGLLIHGQIDAKFSKANQFRDDLDFGPNIQRLGDYLREQNQKLLSMQQEIRGAAEIGQKRKSDGEPTRIAEELLDRIIVQRSRNLCKEIERQQGSNVDLMFRPDAGSPEKLEYSDEYDGIHDVLGGFLPLFERDEESIAANVLRPLSLKIYMWYDVRMGIKSADDVSPVVGLQRTLVLKRLESSPVSFLITLLRLTILHAYRLQNLIDLCLRVADQNRKDKFQKEVNDLLQACDAEALDKIRTLATGDVTKLPRADFLKRLGDAHLAKNFAAETDDASPQLSLFAQEDDESLEAKEELDRLWGLKGYLLQDLATLLQVTPKLADIVFGSFELKEWPRKFTRESDEVDWPRSIKWGMRIVTDAKIRALIGRLLQARRQGQKAIVFSQFGHSLAYVNSVLRATETFTPDGWRMVLPAFSNQAAKAEDILDLIKATAVITGATEERDEVVNAFAPFYRIGPNPPVTEGASLEEHSQIMTDWKDAWRKALASPIQVLLSSDVLAEGVNLQDAATLINFDVHWNPVRMIQRAGRIDRRLNPAIEKGRSFPELEELANSIGANIPDYYWHGREQEAPLTVNMILPDELERELLLRERIALKTLAIDFTLGLDQGTGAEAEWMENYTYQGVSSLNAFQKDRAIELIAGYHEKIGRNFKERGIQTEWAENLNLWIREQTAGDGEPLIGRALLGRQGGAVERFARYLEPTVHNDVPYWFWAEKVPGESLFDGWLIMDGRRENFPPRPIRDIPWGDKVSQILKASHLLGVALALDQGAELVVLPREEIGRPLMQGISALAAPKLGTDEDRRQIMFRDLFILQLSELDPEKLGGRIA